MDFVLSTISFFDCLAASIVISIYTCSQCGELIAADVFGFITSILYFVEIYLAQENAPDPMSMTVKHFDVPYLMFYFRVFVNEARINKTSRGISWAHNICVGRNISLVWRKQFM